MPYPNHAKSVELTVPFHDCDPLAVVWHGRYIEYFEAAREALLDSVQLNVPDLIKLGIRMYVTEVRARYIFPLQYGDRFRVVAWFSEYEPLLKIAYEVHNVTRGRKSSRAFTRLALTDVEGRLMPQMPSVFVERLPALGT